MRPDRVDSSCAGRYEGSAEQPWMRVREQLRAHGLAEPPDLDTLWLEYRRAMVWGVYIGWLTTPVINYGWEITVMNHLRIMTAYEDLETAKAIAELG